MGVTLGVYIIKKTKTLFLSFCIPIFLAIYNKQELLVHFKIILTIMKQKERSIEFWKGREYSMIWDSLNFYDIILKINFVTSSDFPGITK